MSSNADSYLTNSIHDLISLKGRTTVITGGGRGLGLAFAFAIAEAGGNVAIIDFLEKPHDHYYKLEKDYGVKVKLYNIPSNQRLFPLLGTDWQLIIRSDVTNFDALKESFDQIVKDFGGIHGLVTAAGICPDEPFLERAPDSVARCFNVNVLGTYYAAQLAAAQIARQEPSPRTGSRGSIVFIASIAAYVASKGQNTSDYCSSKGAVVSLAKALGVELAAKNIRVNSVSPGYMKTDMTLDLCDKYPWLGDIMNNEPPMRRMGDRTDLKVPIVYLLSDASAYHTSDDLLITGGIHAGRLM